MGDIAAIRTEIERINAARRDRTSARRYAAMVVGFFTVHGDALAALLAATPSVEPPTPVFVPDQCYDHVFSEASSMLGQPCPECGHPYRSTCHGRWPATPSVEPPATECGCRADTELATAGGCAVCGHRDHGRAGCRTPVLRPSVEPRETTKRPPLACDCPRQHGEVCWAHQHYWTDEPGYEPHWRCQPHGHDEAATP